MVYKMIEKKRNFQKLYFNISMLFPYWEYFSAEFLYYVQHWLFRYYSSFKFVRHLNSFCLIQKFFTQSHNKWGNICM